MIEVGAVLSILDHHLMDFINVVVMLCFTAVVGFWQEFQAANAVEALKKQLALKARGRRSGNRRVVEAAELVPGDVIRIRPGDIIPADTILSEGGHLSVDQSALTGESLPVDRGTEDAVFSGSIAKQGEMVALVTSTGANTYFGKTAKLVSSAKSDSHRQKAVLTIGDYLIYLSVGLAAALASRSENQDAIDTVVIEGVGPVKHLTGYVQDEFVPFDPEAKRFVYRRLEASR